MDSWELNETLPKEIIGARINSFTLSEDRQEMRLFTNGGVYTLTTEGECCSVTWIEHIEGDDALVDAIVRSVDAIDMPERPYDPNRYDSVTFYGLRIITSKGYVIIDYRNDSNGYYGGTINWTKE